MSIDLKFTEDDLNVWIAKHRMLFKFNPKHYTPDHVSWLARAVGFDAGMVYRRFSHFDDALAGTSIDRRAAQKANWTVSEILMRDGLDLTDSWMALGNYLTEGLDFKE